MPLSRRPFLASTAFASAALGFTGLAALLAPRPALAVDTIDGSGTAATQRRDLSGFTAIGLGGPFEVVLRPAARDGVEVRGDDNLLALVETTIESSGGKRSLRIDLKKGVRIRPRTPVVVTVDFVRLDAVAVGGDGRLHGSGLSAGTLALSLGGSGTIALAKLDGSELDVSIGGSGRVEVDGRAKKLDVSIAGSGRLEAARLVAAEVAVSIAGSGDARVHADGALSVSIAGSGNVSYSGSAAPSSSIVGSGQVRRAS